MDREPERRRGEARCEGFNILSRLVAGGQWLVTAAADRGDLMLIRTDGSHIRRLTHENGWFHACPLAADRQ